MWRKTTREREIWPKTEKESEYIEITSGISAIARTGKHSFVHSARNNTRSRL